MRCCIMFGAGAALLLSVAMAAASSSASSEGCPVSCTCKWKSGKQTVECIDKELLVIPDGMDSGTQVLEFCGNNLQTLHRDKFLKMGLIHLQRIYLCRCRITSVDDRAFKGLTNLVELDLSGNLLESVPSETFLDCPSLMRLTLSANPIKSVRKAAFNHLSFLSSLELADCEISKVEEGAFHGLYRLEWLHLNGNRMTTLRATSYLPESLKGLQLEENPWECDCHILELHAWLTSAFAYHQTVEPVCNGPPRLRGRLIKPLPVNELACLPDVSPTTFYLEIGEGKNVSLLCQVHAVPEAAISWRFQGQLLQNDSIIAPGVHLIYYIEEGTVEKRSELFIYNANTDDNGTFICSAENPAGLSQANFTIRVIIRPEPQAEPNEIPFEFVLIMMSAVAVSIVFLLLLVILSIIKCHRNARLKNKRNKSKSTKDNLLTQESADEYSDHYKESSSVKLVCHEEEALYAGEELRSVSPVVANLVSSPTSLNYQVERNPDLINGTESARYRECDSSGYHTPLKKRVLQTRMVEFKGSDREMYVLPPDVRLNPVGLLNPTPCYKTLPYNRNKHHRQTAANPIGRYSREAEFLSRSVHPVSYEHYATDVRHTADGYPVRTSADGAPPAPGSPAESHKSDGALQPCCSSAVKSVAAQTDAGDVKSRPLNKSLSNLVKVHETLTESPDEGYEGDAPDNTCQN